MSDRVKSRLQQANEIRSEQGSIALLVKAIGFIYRRTLRRILPTTGYYTNAGIPVRERKPLDSVIPGIPYTDNPDHESALISELRDKVQPGDQVVVIGAGSGTTSVIAANLVTESGSVIAFEGSGSRVRQARKTIALNGVQGRSKVRHAVVGPAIHLSSSAENEVERLPPTELPDCDVLELDCEGAERKILDEMKITPRIIIVETHPHLNAGPDDIREILQRKGYSVVNERDRLSVPVLTAIHDNGDS